MVDVVRKYRELGVLWMVLFRIGNIGGITICGMRWIFRIRLSISSKMMEDVHAMNAHMAISIWSSFGPMTKPYRELDKKGMLFNFTTWPQSGLESWPPNMEYPRCKGV